MLLAKYIDFLEPGCFTEKIMYSVIELVNINKKNFKTYVVCLLSMLPDA